MISLTSKFYDQVRHRRDENVEIGRSSILASLGQFDYYEAMVAATIGSMSRLLGEEATAQEYFHHAASLYWPHDQVAPPGFLDDGHDLAVKFLCRGAIYAHLNGQTDRARQLFTWCLERFDMIAPDNLEAWRPGGVREDHKYGSIMMFRAYAEMRTGQWDHVANHAAEAAESFERARRQRASLFAEEKTLPQVLALAAAWHAEPKAENAKRAQEALVRVVTIGRNYLEKVDACVFVWDLQAAMPEPFGAVQIKSRPYSGGTRKPEQRGRRPTGPLQDLALRWMIKVFRYFEQKSWLG